MRAHLGNHRGLVMLLLFSYRLRRSTCSPLSHTALLLTGNILKVSWTNIKWVLSVSRLQSRFVKRFLKGTQSTRLRCVHEILLGGDLLHVQKYYTYFIQYDLKDRYGRAGLCENHLILSSHIWQYCLSSAPPFKIKGLNHDSKWAVYNN